MDESGSWTPSETALAAIPELLRTFFASPDPRLGEAELKGWSELGEPFEAILAEDWTVAVVLPKPLARQLGLVPANSPYGLCVWDPRTGRIVCAN